MQRLIPNHDLTPDSVPAIDVRRLHLNLWDEPSGADWGTVWEFALTFDGYSFTGMDADQLDFVCAPVRKTYESKMELPITSLTWLRTLLYYEQRLSRATNDSGRITTQYAAYLQALLDGIRAELRRAEDLLIPTNRLRVDDIPVGEPDALDDDQARWSWHGDTVAFARSFAGYRYFGGGEAVSRLRAFSLSVEAEFKATGVVPELGEIGMLRACLFDLERRWSERPGYLDGPTEAEELYAAALLKSLRTRLSHGS